MPLALQRSSTLFLPFTPVGRAIELQAIAVKRRLGMGAYESVEPATALRALPARLIDRQVIDQRSPQLATTLFTTHADGWSAIGYGTMSATGEDLILVNPTHHPHRQKASLMEEIIHIALDHPKTQLTFGPGMTPWTRPYDEHTEDEAYNVGAACLVPYRDLFKAVHTNGENVRVIADRYDVSEAYIKFRIKRAGLSRVYKKRNPTPVHAPTSAAHSE